MIQLTVTSENGNWDKSIQNMEADSIESILLKMDIPDFQSLSGLITINNIITNPRNDQNLLLKKSIPLL
jgi:hypothetical protein